MLISTEIADRFVNACGLNRDSRVFEIGAGQGIITERLGAIAGSVVSFEIDRGLFAYTQERLRKLRNIELICGDAFEYPLEEKFDALVTSLPYSESLRFIKWLGLHSDRFSKTFAIVQLEFSEKLASEPCLSRYRPVSVIAQVSFDMDVLFSIGRENFDPRPRVSSVAIKLIPKTVEGNFFDQKRLRILNFIFSFRGRLLSSALKKLGLTGELQSIPEDFRASRVECLTSSDYARLLPIIEEALG